MSFLPTPRNGEQNYHYIELTWVKKVLTKLIEYNLQKKIDCDLTSTILNGRSRKMVRTTNQSRDKIRDTDNLLAQILR